MHLKIRKVDRRTVLRGVLQGTAVTVALPLLDVFLDDKGTAYASTGAPLAPCFGTWHWMLGLAPGFWEPTAVGAAYELPPHLAPLQPIKSKINIYSGMHVFLDGKVNQNHYSGAQAQMTGMVSKNGSDYTTSIDAIVGDHIGGRRRFRSLEVSCSGDRRSTWSSRGENGMNPSEISPLALYTRIFGPDFVDPNSATFTPDPKVMVRRSVLSAVADERRVLMDRVSAADRARLDQYFESVRDIEQKFAAELERPAPLPSCTVPALDEEESLGTHVEQVRATHRKFATLLAYAMACGQTQVINLSICGGGGGSNSLSSPGERKVHHSLTHEEPLDPALGYQPKCKEYAEISMGFLTEFVQTLDGIREGEGTLLDRTGLFVFTDHGDARVHSMQRYPIFTAGSAGGRMKTGLHVKAEGDSATRVGFTLQRAFGVPNSSWGTESNETSKPFSEVLTGLAG
ncbi:MAG: DUF1552 domain-containing protein [Acidimicrobiia bacterium]|nr:DUF1552 domain-containing protein [Acidimicrobiia bacterium]